MRVGKCRLQRGEYAQAEEALKKALALEPKNAQVQAELEQLVKLRDACNAGESALASGDIDRAMVFFSSVLMSTPDSFAAKRGAAHCYLRKKNYVKATELIREVLNVDSNDEVAHLIRAETLYYSGSVEAATKIFVTLLELDPDSSKIRALLKKAREVTKQKDAADKFFREGNHQAALEAYTAALSVDADLDALNAKLYCNRAGSYSALRQWEDALTDCNQAIILDEKYARAYVRRAKCYTALEKYQEAVYDWGKAKELDPENKDNITGLRDAQRALKKAQRKDYYKLLEISPNATDSEIKKAYRVQALKWHPDKHNETPESYAAAEIRFKDITEANTVLSDPKARRRYDSGEDLEDEPQFGGGAGFSPEMFTQFFGGGGGGFGGGGFGGFPFGGFDASSSGDHDHSHHSHGGGRQGKSGGRRQQQSFQGGHPFFSFQ
jgi:DnaJ family protein C protein 7